MIRHLRTLLMLSAAALPAALSALPYPTAKKGDTVDELHGVKVPDPYRWLEDDNSPETKAWVADENKVTSDYLKALPHREEIRDRLSKLWNYERTGQPQRRGDKWFFSHNSGLQNQPVLMVADALDAEPRLLLDPNTFSADGTVSLAGDAPSEDGKLLAYSISRGGSDWNEIMVRDVTTGKDLPDHLKWVKFSGMSWAKDGSGFYYSRYDEPKEGQAMTQTNEFQKLYFHKLGAEQSADELIYERKDHAKWGIGAGLTDDGNYLLIHITEGSDAKNRVFYKDMTKPGGVVVELLPDADAEYDFIDNRGTVFYFRTNLDAPRNRIIAIDIAKPERKDWQEVVKQDKDLLQAVSPVGGQLICEYLQDAHGAVKAYDFEGKLIRDVELPGLGSAGGFGGKKEDKETFYSFTSFTDPGAIYRYDVASGKSVLWKRPKVDFDTEAYETKQVFFPSKDGTKVPMFIVAKKGTKLDGNNPTLLYGYGGFNINLTPGFSVARAVWLERGGVFVSVNLRGGGEYGADWHEAGTRLRKQNVFDDFISAAEWLIKEKYTSTPKLAIQGGSNGGLLVGACLTQRPDLYGAALPAVGVMDMLRFHKFTIGWAWEKDYGSAENAEEFQAIYKYSPYHNIKPGVKYPATLVTTADHDDRVVPAHSFKFAARLQEDQAKDGPPVLIRVESSAGHGAGTALSKTIERTADEWAFLESALKVK